jgi:hypothetical protein
VHTICVVWAWNTSGVVIIIVEAFHARTICKQVGAWVGYHAIIRAVEGCIVEAKVADFTEVACEIRCQIALCAIQDAMIFPVAITGKQVIGSQQVVECMLGTWN